MLATGSSPMAAKNLMLASKMITSYIIFYHLCAIMQCYHNYYAHFVEYPVMFPFFQYGQVAHEWSVVID